MVKIAKRFLPFFAICAARSAAQMVLSNSRLLEDFVIKKESMQYSVLRDRRFETYFARQSY